MAGINYVGRTPSGATDIATRIAQANIVGAATPGQVSAQTEINTDVALKGAKTYIDTQASQFTTPSYYEAQDLLNLPNSAVGEVYEVLTVDTALPNSTYYGAASLDSTTKIPIAQVSPVGAGYVKGAFGPTAGIEASTTTTPAKVADWDIGVQSVTCVLICFVDIMVTSTMGKPVLDIMVSNGEAAYLAQTLVARGLGRTCWQDEQVLSADSFPGTNGATGPVGLTLAANTNIWVSAWIYDALGQTVSTASDSVVNGAVYLMRTSQ